MRLMSNYHEKNAYMKWFCFKTLFVVLAIEHVNLFACVSNFFNFGNIYSRYWKSNVI